MLVVGGCTSDGVAATDGGSESTAGGSTSASTTTAEPEPEPELTGEPDDHDPWLCPTEQAPDPRFVLGWDYKDGWIDLEREGPITITVGGQGAWMVPLGVRAEGFCVPADPYAYDLVPTLDVRIEAEGHASPVAAVVGFPVSFQPRREGGFHYTFIPMIIADELDPYELHGVPATITAELRPRDVMPLSWQLDGVLVMSD
ncbi:hypothetical protein [Paraliomyxa miuraensis]|uniref:hypothetical protein n=1 Tax=Paraliomyxa miuraensis TaxID=376150 RepID=UPI00225AEC36|nr:hypothetical protein [Paraliomyxa miuraensis]MCX4241624.1 hypothetical protein [Paraliomyxa miuraensis]